MRVLGIDPSTKMGFVILDLYDTNVVTIYHTEYHAPGKGCERLGAIATRLEGILSAYKPTMIALEGYSFGSKFNHEIMYSIGTVLRYFLWQQEYNYQLIPPTTLKKFVTGKGNSKKDLMLKAVFKNWAFDTNNDNEADAYALALYAIFHELGIADVKGVWKKGDAKNFTYMHQSNLIAV